MYNYAKRPYATTHTAFRLSLFLLYFSSLFQCIPYYQSSNSATGKNGSYRAKKVVGSSIRRRFKQPPNQIPFGSRCSALALDDIHCYPGNEYNREKNEFNLHGVSSLPYWRCNLSFHSTKSASFLNYTISYCNNQIYSYFSKLTTYILTLNFKKYIL